jgi:hypothetical protein
MEKHSGASKAKPPPAIMMTSAKMNGLRRGVEARTPLGGEKINKDASLTSSTKGIAFGELPHPCEELC